MQQEQTQAGSQRSDGYQPIEDYAIIGDLHTVALVGKNGSIDWCCIPRFDSPSVFGALLDANKGGFFRIAPSPTLTTAIRHKHLYLPETNILLTRFLTVDGVGELIDFMPIKREGTAVHQHHIIRAVKVLRGSLPFEMICRPAFNYAQDAHTVTHSQNGAIFHTEALCLGLDSSIPLEADGQGGVRATFTLNTNQWAYFVLESARDHDIAPAHINHQQYQHAFNETVHYWHHWLSQCQYQGRWREMVQRSALALKLMTYAPSGAIVAAATTSLPETMGGQRNWDYRYTWLRDASFTLYSLLILGFTQEASAFMGWLDARCHELKENGSLQPMYTIDGGHDLQEFTLSHLEGYRKSAPVRIGNGAYKQKQLDVYGELMDSIFIFDRHQDISYDLWQNLRRLLGWLSAHWQEPDEGIWEVRGGAKQFVHSRVMSWVAFDRALRIARHRGLPAPISEWENTSAQIYEQVMQAGWNEKKRSFVQYYGSDAIDASALLMVLTKFTGPLDPYMHDTLKRIQKELTRDSFVYRYDPRHAADDGLGTTEGSFSPCSFWLVETLARTGQIDDARFMLEKNAFLCKRCGIIRGRNWTNRRGIGQLPTGIYASFAD